MELIDIYRSIKNPLDEPGFIDLLIDKYGESKERVIDLYTLLIKTAKKENVGTYAYKVIGYYTTFEALLKRIGFTHFLESVEKDNINTIEDLCAEIHEFNKRAQEIGNAMLIELNKSDMSLQ